MRTVLFTLTLVAVVCIPGAPRVTAFPHEAERETWKSIKAGLLGTDGDEYYRNIYNALLPRLSGTVISVLENEGLSKVVVAITDTETPEVTLIVHNGKRKLTAQLKGREIAFEAVVTAFDRNP